MNPMVLTSFGAPDPNASPVNITQLVALLNTLITSAIQGSYIPYVLGSTTPIADDNDKAWIKTDSSGRPISVNTFYNGNWRRVYNGMPGEVRLYNGNPVIDFDTNGLGIIGGNFDGWHIMNGLDGTPDWSDKLPMAAHMNNVAGHTGYSSGWQTFVNGLSDLKTGGAASVTLTPAQVPLPAKPAVLVDRYHADGNANDAAGDLYGVNSVQHVDLVPADPGLATPASVSILNPFVASAFIIFVGYA